MRSFPTFLLSMAESNLILRSCCEAVLTTFACQAVSLPRSRLSVVSRQSRSRMALRNLIRNYRSRFISKNGSTRRLRLCLRSSVLTQKQDGQHERAAALPANSHADPNVRAALGGLRPFLPTPIPTQGTNGPPRGGCGFACEPPCWTTKQTKRQAALEGLRHCLRTSMPALRKTTRTYPEV